MSENQPASSNRPDSSQRVGKVRTWWHPFLVRLLRYGVGAAFEVEEEVSVGDQPLRVDVLLLRKQSGELDEKARRMFPELVDLLADYSYIEFKGPTDALERADFEKTLGVVRLHRSEHADDVKLSRVSVIYLAPALTRGFREAVATNDLTITEVASGCHRIEGGPFTVWCVETSIDAGRLHPALSLLSPAILKQSDRIIRELTSANFSDILNYVIQLIRQFQKTGSNFEIHHAEAEFMVKLNEDVKKSFLEGLTVEERQAGLTVEERLAGLTIEERLEGLAEDQAAKRSFLDSLTLEERLAGLSLEELKQALPPELLKALQEHRPAADADTTDQSAGAD